MLSLDYSHTHWVSELLLLKNIAEFRLRQKITLKYQFLHPSVVWVCFYVRNLQRQHNEAFKGPYFVFAYADYVLVTSKTDKAPPTPASFLALVCRGHLNQSARVCLWGRRPWVIWKFSWLPRDLATGQKLRSHNRVIRYTPRQQHHKRYNSNIAYQNAL